MNTDRFELIRGDASKVPFNYHITDNIGAEAAAAYNWIAGETSVGIDMAYNHILSTVLGDECAPKRIRGIEYNHSKGRTTVNTTLRHEKRWRRLSLTGAAGVSRSDYGTDALWNIGAGYTAGRYWSFDAGVVESMRLPTYTDLYYTAAGYRSDRNLKPEHALTYHLAAQYEREGWQAGLYTYYRRGRNVIDWVKQNVEDDWQSMQITRMNTLGAELSLAYVTSGWMRRASIGYGYIHQDSDSKGMISKYALDYMRNKLSLRLDTAPARRLTLSLTGTLYDRIGSYAGCDGAVHSYSPYFLLDARAAYDVWKMRIYVDATNITSTRYYDYGGLRMPDCWVTAGVIFTFR